MEAGFGILRQYKGGIRDFSSKWRRDSGLKVYTGCGMAKITLGIEDGGKIEVGMTRLFLFLTFEQTTCVRCSLG